MKKILIAGASTFGVKNQGDDAMFYNLVNGLHRKLECKIIFLARHPDAEWDKVFGVESVKNYEHDSKKASLGRWFNGFNPGDKTDHLKRIHSAIEDCDLVIIGGNSFMEVSQNDFLRGVASYSTLLAIWARFFAKPFVLYGLAVNPLEGDYTKQLARFLCMNAEIVAVREEFSRQNLLNAGVDCKNVQVFADPAYGVDPVSDKKSAIELLEKEKINLGTENVVGICFRHLYWKWTDKEFEENAVKMADICDYIIEELGATLLFIPNCTYNVDTLYEDDRVISKVIASKMKNSAKAMLVQGDYKLPEVLSLFQVLKLHISNRRHSCIFAAIHNVPFIALSTGEKFVTTWHLKPFMEDLSISGQTVSFSETPLGDFKARIKETWASRQNLSKVLQSKVPALRGKAQKQVDAIVDSIK